MVAATAQAKEQSFLSNQAQPWADPVMAALVQCRCRLPEATSPAWAEMVAEMELAEEMDPAAVSTEPGQARGKTARNTASIPTPVAASLLNRDRAELALEPADSLLFQACRYKAETLLLYPALARAAAIQTPPGTPG